MNGIRFLCVTAWFAPVIFVWREGRKGFWAELYYKDGRPQMNKVTAVLAECPYLADEYENLVAALKAVPQNGKDPQSPQVLAFASLEAAANYLEEGGNLIRR
jgi:hypothetical protein